MGHCVDPGRPSEALQATIVRGPETSQPSVPQSSAHPVAPPAPPAPPVAPPVATEKVLDPSEYDKTGRLPVEALPKDELLKIAETNNIVVAKGASREAIVSALKAKNIVDISVDK